MSNQQFGNALGLHDSQGKATKRKPEPGPSQYKSEASLGGGGNQQQAGAEDPGRLSTKGKNKYDPVEYRKPNEMLFKMTRNEICQFVSNGLSDTFKDFVGTFMGPTQDGRIMMYAIFCAEEKHPSAAYRAFEIKNVVDKNSIQPGRSRIIDTINKQIPMKNKATAYHFTKEGSEILSDYAYIPTEPARKDKEGRLLNINKALFEVPSSRFNQFGYAGATEFYALVYLNIDQCIREYVPHAYKDTDTFYAYNVTPTNAFNWSDVNDTIFDVRWISGQEAKKYIQTVGGAWAVPTAGQLAFIGPSR